MAKIETRKCPICGGTMIRSKKKIAGHARFFWYPPWKSKTTGILKPVIDAVPWLCLDCGVVLAFVDEEKLQILRAEFEEKKTEVSL